ncbi:MAG TPA: P27 family phage terminase small subunit [Metalysinibacillus sp.]
MSNEVAIRLELGNREQVRSQIIKDMEDLGTYKKEFASTIDIYVDLLYDYEKAYKNFEDNGSVFVLPTATGFKTNPVWTAIKDTRQQIGIYSDKLQLNPKSLGMVVEVEKEEKKSKLEQALAIFDG